MRNATTYARKIKRLLTKIKKEAAKDPPVEIDGATETLLLGVLSRTAPQKKAAEALSRLTESTVDLNDLRVTPVAELVQIVGVGYPEARSVCEEVSQVLAGVFNQIHELDLSFLKSVGKKAAASFLDSLDGLSQHANAFFTLQYLNSAAVAMDDRAYEYLVKTNHLPAGTDIVEAHKFMRTHFKEFESGVLSAALKLHARSAAGRKEMRAGAADAGAEKKTRKRPATTKKKTAKKARTAKKTTKSTGRTTSKKKAAKKHRR